MGGGRDGGQENKIGKATAGRYGHRGRRGRGDTSGGIRYKRKGGGDREENASKIVFLAQGANHRQEQKSSTCGFDA